MTEKTETKRVTLETIAEWRAEIENDIESWGKDYKGMAREDLHGREIKILDALEAAQTELATLRGQRQESEAAFGEWFEAHFADWLRAMRGGFRHDDIRHFRDSLLTAWSAALRGQVGGKALPSPRVLRDGMVEVPAGEYLALRGCATGEIPHIYEGQCPDAVEGPHVRDPECRVCRALLSGEDEKGMAEVPAEEWAAMSAIGYDPEPCRHDHHGYCQEHGWFSLEPCPTGIMQRLRAAKEAE